MSDFHVCPIDHDRRPEKHEFSPRISVALACQVTATKIPQSSAKCKASAQR
jgi:hypothetical protein